MLRFLPHMINSTNIAFTILLDMISAITSLKTIATFRFLLYYNVLSFHRQNQQFGNNILMSLNLLFV